MFKKYLAEIFRVIVDETQSVFSQRVEDVQTMDLVSLGDGEVEADEGQQVGLRDAERGVQAGDKVRHLVEADELGGVRVKPAKVKIVFYITIRISIPNWLYYI